MTRIIITFLTFFFVTSNASCQNEYDASKEVTTHKNFVDSILRKPQLKVLDIGNSYSVDATSLLPLIAQKSGADLSDMCLYLAYRGGASFKNWYNVYKDLDSATYYSIGKVLGGLTPNITLGKGEPKDGSLFRKALTDEKWDIIIIHQVSTYAPYYDLWNSDGVGGCLSNLISIIKQHQPQAMLGLLLIHSYTDDYPRNQEKSSFERWEKIAQSTLSCCQDYHIDFVIPYGTAVQNLRASSLNNEYQLTRDGTHCGYGLCRYAAACCYYEALIAPRTGISVLGNSARYDASNDSSKYPPVSVTDDNAEIAQKAAVLAVKDWMTCTNPELYEPENTSIKYVSHTTDSRCSNAYSTKGIKRIGTKGITIHHGRKTIHR